MQKFQICEQNLIFQFESYFFFKGLATVDTSCKAERRNSNNLGEEREIILVIYTKFNNLRLMSVLSLFVFL
jgi:hypothetical protein